MKRLYTPFILFALLTCASCASIVSKSYYNVSLKSSPDTARVQVFDRDGREIFNGITPTEVELRSGAGYFKRAEYTIKYTKEGFQSKEILIFADINGWYFGNIVFGGLIGLLIVDPVTGAMYRLNNTMFHPTLTPQGSGTTGSGAPVNNTAGTATSASSEKTLHIMELQQVPEHLRKHLVQLQ